jgi:ribosomal protein S18 acetylase RimI-like enzyme
MIRKYKSVDWKKIVEIYNISKPDELKGTVDLRCFIPLEDDPKMIKYFQDSDIYVEEIENKVVAFAGNKNNVISWLFVHPEYRRKGIAEKLLTQILNSLSGEIKLNVGQMNEAAKSLYFKLGFTIEKKFIGNNNGFEAKAMTLKLNK